MVEVTESLAGRYELLEVVGRGAIGVVYRATDRVLRRDVAVKVLAGERGEDPVWVARFEREALATAALNHPHIVAVYDTGLDAGTRFIVMQYVAGRSLADVLHDGGRLPARRAAQIAMQIAGALGAAHRAGIVHRDVKPANVMLDHLGSAKVLDFGIARFLARTSLTQTAVVVGSAPYLAPEVTRGERADERSDVYSLGCVLYELLSGRPPFGGEHAAAIMHQHNSAHPRPPRDLDGGVPAALDALVMQMLAKRPQERPLTAQVVSALESCAEGPRPAPRAPRPEPRAVPEMATEPSRPLSVRRRPKRRARLAIGALAVLLFAALLVALLVPSGSRPRQAASKAPAASKKALATATPRRRARPASARKAASSSQTQPAPAAAAVAPTTVPAAAQALTTLLTGDLQSGAIDKHGEDLLHHLSDALSSRGQGRGDDSLHKLNDLTRHVADLSSHGDIQPSALPALQAALQNLRMALLRTASAPGPPGPRDSGIPPRDHQSD